MLSRALQAAAGNGISTVAAAEAIDFDGTNDSLSSGSAIPGFTGTFSFWLLVPSGSAQPVYRELMTSGLEAVKFSHNGSSTLSITFYNSNGGQTQAGTVGVGVAVNTWTHILFSVDRTAAGSFPVYVNDIQSGTLTLSQDALAARDNVTLPRNNGSPSHGKLRLSNFLVRNGTYDFSIVANRRLFITADLKPAADQAALNPLIYLPMDDPTQPGLNAGTGGDFTLTGVVARSGRGPNQYNAPYSDLDGAADYLSRTTAPTGIADGKQFTFQCVFNVDSSTTNYSVVTMASSTSERLSIQLYGGGVDGGVNLYARNSAGTLILNAAITAPLYVAGRNIVLSVSIDLSDTAKRFVYINGVAATVTWNTYTNADIDFAITTTPRYYIGVGPSLSSYLNGRLGALWFNTSYIDLSQPANLAKFVTGTGIDAKPVDLGANGELPTGTSPLIYLPMYGNNAGKNYGTGGDFTVNSGPYTGARGPNEFWLNKATFNGTTGYLSASSTSMSASKTFTLAMVMRRTTAQNQYPFAIGGTRFLIQWDATDVLTVSAQNSSGTTILNATFGSTWTSGSDYIFILSVDLSSASLRSAYRGTIGSSTINSITATWSTYTNDFIDFTRVSSTERTTVGAVYTGGSASNYFAGSVSFLYFSTQYTNFSVEANRLKFFDCFGYAANLPLAITEGAVPNPPIYMRFPPTAFGTNSGTDGDFTVNGTITDGGQL